MQDVDFEKYSENSVHFFSRRVPSLLVDAITRTGRRGTVVDIGCGDGHLVWALSQKNLLLLGQRVVGVDVSPVRASRFRSLTGYEALVADGHNVPALVDAEVDLAISTMVIEHLVDEREHLRELARIVRPGGLLYLTTVIRKRGAWYFRKTPDGRRVLDPTHLREYSSPTAVLSLFDGTGFAVREYRLSGLVFPILHPLIRLVHTHVPIQNVQRIFLKPPMAWLEWLALPIPRYGSIEVLAERTQEPAR